MFTPCDMRLKPDGGDPRLRLRKRGRAVDVLGWPTGTARSSYLQRATSIGRIAIINTMKDLTLERNDEYGKILYHSHDLLYMDFLR